jgi:hypothetical protein
MFSGFSCDLPHPSVPPAQLQPPSALLPSQFQPPSKDSWNIMGNDCLARVGGGRRMARLKKQGRVAVPWRKERGEGEGTALGMTMDSRPAMPGGGSFFMWLRNLSSSSVLTTPATVSNSFNQTSSSSRRPSRNFSEPCKKRRGQVIGIRSAAGLLALPSIAQENYNTGKGVCVQGKRLDR